MLRLQILQLYKNFPFAVVFNAIVNARAFLILESFFTSRLHFTEGNFEH